MDNKTRIAIGATLQRKIASKLTEQFTVCMKNVCYDNLEEMKKYYLAKGKHDAYYDVMINIIGEFMNEETDP